MHFQAYFDTGGSEASPDGNVIATAGLVATFEKWQKFDRRWLAALAEFGVRDFHMKEFAHSKGEFDLWRDDKERRERFLDRLAREVKRGINKAFISAVIVPDYRRVNAKYALTEAIGGPYSLAQSGCFDRALSWIGHRKGLNARCEVFVEKGDAGQPAFRRFIGGQLEQTVNFLTRHDENGAPYTPLHACDFLAYEYRLEYHKVVATGRRPDASRESLTAIRRLIPVNVGIYDADALEEICTVAGIAERVHTL